VENTGLENEGPNRRCGKCRTGKCGTKLASLQQEEIYYFQFGGFQAHSHVAAQMVNNYKILI